MCKEEKPIEFKESVIYGLFFLIGLLFPYVVCSIFSGTANLFSWEIVSRIYLLISTPISILFFILIGHLLLMMKIFLKRLLYHITLLLVGIYLLCVFIEAKINIFKWEYVFNFYNNNNDDDSTILFIHLFILSVMSIGFYFIAIRDIKEKSK